MKYLSGHFHRASFRWVEQKEEHKQLQHPCCSFIQSRYLLVPLWHVLGTVVTAANKKEWKPCLYRTYILVGQMVNKQK